MDTFAGQLITLQFGSFSNFIGTHYWNIQEETISLGEKLFAPAVQVMDHDTLFRQGQTMKEETTYTPRLLIFDLKGGYGTLRKGGYQYEEYVASSKHFINKQHVHQAPHHAQGSSEHHNQNLNVLEEEMKMKYARAWSGEVEVIAEEPREKTKFLKLLYGEESATTTSQQTKQKSGMEEIDEDLDELSASSAPQPEKPLSQQVTEDLEANVKYWSDYLKPFLHPKSICEITDFKYDIDPFDVFPVGHQLFQDQKIDKEDNEYFNQLRFFMEECDHLKGFQLFFDQHNAWGAVASDFVGMLRDDIGTKIPIITFGSTPYFDSIEPRSNTAMNLALSMASMLPHSSLYTPLSSKRLKNHFAAVNQEDVGLVNFNAEKAFHASALFAMAIDTATSNTRLKSQNSGFYSLNDLINTLTVHPSLKVATLCGSAPLPLLKGQSFYDMLYKNPITQFPYLVSMSPGYDRMKNPKNPFGHATTIRGISDKNMTLYPKPEAPTQLSVQEQIALLMSGRQLPQQKPFRHEDLENRELANCNEYDEMFYNYIYQTNAQQVKASIIEQSTVVPEAYPDILSSSLLSNGFIIPKNQIPEKQTVLSMPTMSHLQTNAGITTYIKQCANSIDKNTKFNVPYPYSTVSKDDYGEMKEILLSTMDAYDE